MPDNEMLMEQETELDHHIIHNVVFFVFYKYNKRFMFSACFTGLVNLSCPDSHDIAFQNFRMLQGLGAALAFSLGAFVCVDVKIYIIISLMVVAILCYGIAEYRIRQEADPYMNENW